MAILKSEIVGKSIGELKGIITGGTHPTWRNFSTDAVDFLSRCTLRYSNSYGATYKIDPTSELTIIHSNGTKYLVDSYRKLLTMIIVDYTEPTGTTMPTNIRDYYININNITKAERNELYEILTKHNEPVGSNFVYTRFTWKFIKFFNSSNLWKNSNKLGRGTTEISIEDFIKLFSKPQEQPMPTQPQLEVKPGTYWERLKRLADHSPKGEIVIVENVTTNHISFSDNRDLSSEEFLNRFKPRPDLDIQTSEPTKNDAVTSKLKVGDKIGYNEEACIKLYHKDPVRCKIIGTVTHIKERDTDKTPLITYKTLLGNTSTIDEEWVEVLPSSTTKTTKPKTKPVAQPELIQPMTKETFMSKLKTAASTTVDQNKQALVIASKMEAGRIINKQILKQLKPHLPFFLQGYASSPFAPLVAANLVAMVANHTQNSKLLKVSNLMLLGAADSGVTSFNLNDIVEDILSKIKLPAGILDDSDDE